MTANYEIENIDCANCAKRLENAINDIPDVECRLSFAMGRMKITAPEESFDEVMKKVMKTIKKLEPQAVVSKIR